MNTSKLGTAFAGALLAVGVMSSACVADRPSRNGVFNENQYVRKDWLIQNTDTNGASPGTDPGWFVHAVITEASTPNLMGAVDGIGAWAGLVTGNQLVRFRVTSDKLQMLDQIQFSTPQQPDPKTGAPGPYDPTGATETVDNAWPATNVDLKYRVNLDGEKTNFYEENQELDWQVRQWVKLNFDKNDFSDLAPLGPITNMLLEQCGDTVDASATLVPGSFIVTPGATSADDYMEFTVQVSVPMNVSFPDQATADLCAGAYGGMLSNALKIGRYTATVNLKYSFMRAKPVSALTYKPLVVDEKDKIRTKYGPIYNTVFNRDNQTQLLAATQYVERFDPTKPIVWYFDQNFPEYYKPVFVGDGKNNPGIQGETNKILTAAGVKAQVTFLNYNDDKKYQDKAGPSRQYGDIRYSFLRWISDEDEQDAFAGVTMDGAGGDPRTGEMMTNYIQFNDYAVKDYVVQRIDAFLTTIGASGGLQTGWATGSCTADQTLVNDTVISKHNATSTLYNKMQGYLGLHGPDPTNDHLGPQDFIATANSKDPDFLNAYFALIPYEVFADPDTNLFVTREGGNGVYGPVTASADLQGEGAFRRLTGQINNGVEPFQTVSGTQGVLTAAAFANSMRDATNAHQRKQLMRDFMRPGVYMDAPGAFSLETVMAQDAQKCINGTWETQDAWEQRIIDSYWQQQVFWHEFGHGMGLDHNFMASVDMPNFTSKKDASGKPITDSSGNPLYAMYSASVMDYLTAANTVWTQGWGNYDKGAIAWIYANDAKQADDPMKDMSIPSNTRSGEAPGGTYPWKDPLGFCAQGDPDCTAGAERNFLRCDASHIKYSPICRQNDMGVTPSEIIANDIDQYEWQYQWRNFRDYRKVWDESAYANNVSGFIVDQRRFLSQWQFDWSPGEIATTLYRVGVKPPASAPSAVDYYSQLTQKFTNEMSTTNRMVAAFHEALIQQTAGERPYATVYDKFYGDVTQQGIILDKYFAMQEFVGLWTSDNYDQNQAGAYISSWGEFGFDLSYNSVAETAISSMIGSQYAVYPYFIPTAVALFAQDTHNPAFLEANNSGPGTGGERVEAKDWIGGWSFPLDTTFMIDWFKQMAVDNGVCTTVATCTYDVTDPAAVPKDPNSGSFTAPDGLTYVYARIPSRNQWVVARQDRNIVTYKLITNYNIDLNATKDDGTQGAYSTYEYPIKYTFDSYATYE